MEKPDLPKYFFGDIDYDVLDFEISIHQVLQRVFSIGAVKNIETIQKYYGLDLIKSELLNVRYLDDQTLNFCSFLYQMPKDQFRCYKLKQLNPNYTLF